MRGVPDRSLKLQGSRLGCKSPALTIRSRAEMYLTITEKIQRSATGVYTTCSPALEPQEAESFGPIGVLLEMVALCCLVPN